MTKKKCCETNIDVLIELIAKQQIAIERLQDQMKLIYQITGAHIGMSVVENEDEEIN